MDVEFAMNASLDGFALCGSVVDGTVDLAVVALVVLVEEEEEEEEKSLKKEMKQMKSRQRKIFFLLKLASSPHLAFLQSNVLQPCSCSK